MEKLTDSQQLALKKTATERLQARLMKLGWEEEKVFTMDRDALLATWAGLIVQGKDKPPAEPVVVGPLKTLGYDPELEKRRLEFEMRKYEEEMQLRIQELERNEKIRLEELAVKKAELRLREDRDKAEAKHKAAEFAKQDSAVARAKLYGDCIKNTMTRMPNDPIEIVSFFRNVEHLYKTFNVPDDLQASLLRPYLNDRARILVGRLDQDQAQKYGEVKSMLLKEFKLTPATYLERFNSLLKQHDETYLMFVARLTALLRYYIDSRQVTELAELLELLVCDRVKSTLPDGCLKHILSVEAAKEKGWIKSNPLAEAIDRYWANHVGDRPRAYAIGQPSSRPPANNISSQQRAGTQFKPLPPKVSSQSADTRTEVAGEGKQNKKGPGCWICGDLSHRRASCPMQKRPEINGPPASRADVRRVNQAVIYSTVTDLCASSPHLERSQYSCNDNAVPLFVYDEALSPGAVSEPRPATNSVYASEHVTSNPTSVNEVLITPTVANAHAPDGGTDVYAEDFSKLRYVKVAVATEPNSSGFLTAALYDSGAEVAVARSDLFKDVHTECLGSLKLRGIIGQPVSAKLVRLYVTLADVDNITDRKYVPIVCALSDQLNEEFILPADVVEQLMCVEQLDCKVVLRHDGDDHVNDNDSEDDSNVVDSSNDTLVDLECEHNTDANGVFDADACLTPPSECSATRQQLIAEQLADDTLKICWTLAAKGKGGFRVQEGLLYHDEMILGQKFSQLCIPKCRRDQVLRMAHETVGCHAAAKATRARIRLSFFWLTVSKDSKQWCQHCVICQKRSRKTYRDRVPITPIPRADAPFTHWFMDTLGPIFNHKVEYNYCLILCDSATRYPAAYALKNLSAKSICDALLQLWFHVGLPTFVSCDNFSSHCSALTKEFLKRLGCSPRFVSPYHPEGNGLAERNVGTVKGMISKVAADNPKSWHKYLGYIMWALREVPNETTGVPPWLLTYGHLPRGPLAVLKETWCEERELPLNLGKTPTEFLRELLDKLKVAQTYAQSHTDREQQRYATHYNLRSCDKHFDVGDQVLILQPDSTASRTFSKWKGPATVVEVKSPYSYLVELNGTRYRLHANKLRKFHVRVDEVMCSYPIFASAATCAVINERDADFGAVQFVDAPIPKNTLLPSQRIEPSAISHLSEIERTELLVVLDKFPDVFSDSPGYCDAVQHEIPLTADFKPKRLHAYRVPMRLKPEVDRQIQELLNLGLIRPSKSPMASPVVCVLKGKDGEDGVRLAIDYRYLNKYCVADAFPFPDIGDIIQKIGNSKYVSLFDASQGFWQTPVKPEDQWLTAFICDAGLFEWTRTSFGMKNSGNTFVRMIKEVLKSLKEFCDSFVDDMAIYSNAW